MCLCVCVGVRVYACVCARARAWMHTMGDKEEEQEAALVGSALSKISGAPHKLTLAL